MLRSIFSWFWLSSEQKKEGLFALLFMNRLCFLNSYASWIASNTAAPLLTSYGKVVALSSNVML